MRAKHRIWIPVLFTVAYFGYAALSPLAGHWGDWFTPFIRAFLLAAAAVSSGCVWACYGLWSHGKLRRPGWMFAIGLLPIALLGALDLYAMYRVHHLAILDARIRKEARLIRIDDEELLTARGNPIGVRLRYEVNYPEGSGELIRHIPPADLSMIPPPYLSGFWARTTESRTLNATDDAMTVDVFPEFMPGMIRFGELPSSLGIGSSDACFWWPRGARGRTAALTTPPQAFWIYLSTPKYSSRTKRSYDLHRFYEGALSEGAKECS